MLKLGSLFDGIGGWLISAQRNGIRPVWASEVAAFPIAVTKHHFPDVLHMGSVTDMKGDEVDPVDIITSGSPCQDLSVAGNQKGLKGERSGLFFESVRIVREMRAATGGKYPRFYVWENVPGAFSSNKGRDFLAVIEALTEAAVPMPASGKWANAGMVRSGRCDIAWRVLDAQHWGVPQRRKRIFLVADFRAVGERRPEVLFKPESLLGHSPQGEGAGQGAAEAADGCFAIAGNTIERKPGNRGNGKGFQPDLSYTLTGMDRHAVAIRERCGCEGGGKGLLYGDDIAHTLSTGKDQFVLNDQGGKVMSVDDKVATLRAEAHGNIPAVVTYDMTHADDVVRENRTDKIHTLNHRMGTGGNQVPVVQAFSNSCFGGCPSSETGQTLTAKGGGIGGGSNSLVNAGAVRRLTPLECERLQGLPDNYTLIPHKSCSDSARYKAIGNGMAQPCADYVLSVVKRMAE